MISFVISDNTISENESQEDNEGDITMSGTSNAIDEIEMEQEVINLKSKVIELQAELEKAIEFKNRVKPITELFRNPLVTTDKNGSYPINGQMTKFVMLLLW